MKTVRLELSVAATELPPLLEKRSAYEKLLVSKGAKLIGNGESSNVYSVPSGTNVVKVGPIYETAEEEGALVWLEWCRANRSVYVPRIDHLESMDDSYFVCSMEHLKNARMADIQKFIKDNDLQKVLTPKSGHADRFVLSKDIKSKAPAALLEVLRQLSRMTSTAFLLDLKVENFMLRGNQLVFTDPIV